MTSRTVFLKLLFAYCSKKKKRRRVGGVHLLGESNPCCRDENPVS
jgi:hypothetical protein